MRTRATRRRPSPLRRPHHYPCLSFPTLRMPASLPMILKLRLEQPRRTQAVDKRRFEVTEKSFIGAVQHSSHERPRA